MAHEVSSKADLRRLYVFERLGLEKAAIVVGVSVATARRWKQQAQALGDDWDKLRAAHIMAGGDLEAVARQLLTDLVLQFKATMDLLQAEEIDVQERVALLTSLSDSYNKAISANKKLMPETSKLAVALQVIELFGLFVKDKKPALLAEFTALLEPFGASLEQQLK